MLPAQPPEVTSGDFDPATYNLDAEDDAMEVDDEESTVDLSSVEINILIYLVSARQIRLDMPQGGDEMAFFYGDSHVLSVLRLAVPP